MLVLSKDVVFNKKTHHFLLINTFKSFTKNTCEAYRGIDGESVSVSITFRYRGNEFFSPVFGMQPEDKVFLLYCLV